MPPIDSPINPQNTIEGQLSTINLSEESNGPPPVPMNTPKHMAINMELANQTNNALDNTYTFSALMSCFKPAFGFLLPTQNVASSGLDNNSDTEDYEISLESIDVNFKENYIGGGNQSSVFRGKLNGRYIALKKLNRASEVDIKKLMALEHPNVIRTLGICTKDIYPVIVMDFCEKGGLFDVLRKTQVSKSTFIRWSTEIAEGMLYLHSLKIVHRDLKTPNILVDNNDCLKICDFGSLYAWDKTQMPSVVMSVCGTSQWMCPEMLKNEKCNEKVDIWSYGICLWEILTQEVPYKSIAPMAIMYGVGSGKLQLHVPKSAPDSVKFLLRLCWAKQPRNRPSFASVLQNLANLRVEIADLSEDSWTMRKDVWRKEIYEENEKLMVQESTMRNATQVQADELVHKRMHELRHAQEIRQMYEVKMDRVNRMMKKLFRFMEELRIRQEELHERERNLSEKESRKLSRRQQQQQQTMCPKANQRCSANSSFFQSPKSSTSARATSVGSNINGNQRMSSRMVKVQKEMEIRPKAGQQSCCDNQMRFDNAIYSCVPGGQRAVVTMSVDIDSEEDEEGAQQAFNVQNNNQDIKNVFEGTRKDSRDGYASSCSSSGNSCEEDLYHLGPAHGTKCFTSTTNSPAAFGMNSRACGSENSSFARIGSAGSRNQGNYSPSKFTSRSSLSSGVPTMPISSSERNFQSHEFSELPAVCPCCQYSFFSRNSLARVSGVSADSGFCHLEEQPNTDEPKMIVMRRKQFGLTPGSRSMEGEDPSKPCASPLYRNVHGRWSDGRIKSRARRPASHSTAFSRDSPMRTPSLKRERRSYTGGLQECLDNCHLRTHSKNRASHDQLEVLSCERLMVKQNENRMCNCQSVIINQEFSPGRQRPNRASFPQCTTMINSIPMGELEYGVDVDIEPQFPRQVSIIGNQKELPHSLAATITSNGQTGQRLEHQRQYNKASSRNGNVKKARSQPQSPDANCNEEEEEHILDLLDLNQNPEAIVAAVSAALMETSHSTMVSSLERSLEMAVGHSDGLSDKESKLKAAKSSFKTHRRTASNPIDLPKRAPRICETSTESDNDPVYC